MSTQDSIPTHGSSLAAHPERALRVELIVDAPANAVWEAWSTPEGVEAFLAQKAHVERHIGGAYEIFFNPADERLSTKGCKLLSYLPEEMISFEWRLPSDMFPELAEAATWIVVQLRPAGPDRTEVRITQLGWGTGPLWDRAFTHMQAGWQMVAAQLEQRFEYGPINWEALHQTRQERRAESRAAARQDASP